MEDTMSLEGRNENNLKVNSRGIMLNSDKFTVVKWRRYSSTYSWLRPYTNVNDGFQGSAALPLEEEFPIVPTEQDAS